MVYKPQLFLCKISKNGKICGILLYMQINRDSSNCSSCVVYVFSDRCVCPHPIGRVLYRRDIAWFQKWICISEMCIYVYLCKFIYLYVRINRWLYVCVFGLNQNEYKIKQFYELLSMAIMSYNFLFFVFFAFLEWKWAICTGDLGFWITVLRDWLTLTGFQLLCINSYRECTSHKGHMSNWVFKLYDWV